MPVNQEIKSQLAKLLATEDLIVEHKNVQTAEFNVHTRVLTLPKWDRASNNVYDALVAHEVGHALYTPDVEWFKTLDIPHSFVNIVEDVRIEMLMKRRYAGIAKTFYNGYNELNDQDFFDIDGKNLTDFNLADRVNLYYKVGSWNDISFSDAETPILDLIKNAETFDDTLSAAEALYNFCKQELEDKQTQEIDIEQDYDIDLKGSGDRSFDSSDDNNLTVPESGSSNSPESGSGGDVAPSGMDAGGDFVKEPEVRTESTLAEALKDLTDTRSNLENTYFELPKLDLKHVIIPNEFIHKIIDLSWIDQQEIWNKHSGVSDIFEETDEKYFEFKRNAQKEVNYLVKEFECKKSASAYARATTARTGVLDTANLHTYKYNEDLFKKISIVPEGKNHGLVFILDWSGSMSNVILDTLKQLYNLIWFCKKVSIPFEVYAFTNDFPPMEHYKSAYEKKDGLALVHETFSLMNLFSSKVKGKDLEKQLKNIFRIGMCSDHNYWTRFSVPLGMSLSGTPLNETIIALHQILPQFKKQHNLEKVQCVILTDGEGSPLRISKKFERYEDESYWGSNYIHERCILRNRKTGYTYSCAKMSYYSDASTILLNDLRQSFLDVNFIGIRVLASRDAGQFVRQHVGYEDDTYEKIMRQWKKDKAFSIKDAGYHSYFGLSSSALANDDQFEVQEDSTKAQIKRAFVKSLKTKKMNKKILGEFIELVV